MGGVLACGCQCHWLKWGFSSAISGAPKTVTSSINSRRTQGVGAGTWAWDKGVEQAWCCGTQPCSSQGAGRCVGLTKAVRHCRSCETPPAVAGHSHCGSLQMATYAHPSQFYPIACCANCMLRVDADVTLVAHPRQHEFLPDEQWPLLGLGHLSSPLQRPCRHSWSQFPAQGCAQRQLQPGKAARQMQVSRAQLPPCEASSHLPPHLRMQSSSALLQRYKCVE